MSGRVDRAETWAFDCVAHELRLRVGTNLKYLERYTLRPHERSMTHPWVGGGMHYMATALTHHDGVTLETVEPIQRESRDGETSASAPGVGLLDSRLVIGRLLASCGARLPACAPHYRQLSRAARFLTCPLQRLRK